MGLDGEIIEVAGEKVICWITISDNLRVRTAINRSLFDDLPKRAGFEFRWLPLSRRVAPVLFDNATLEQELDALNKEWEENPGFGEPAADD